MTVLKNGNIIFSVSDALEQIDSEIADVIKNHLDEQQEQLDELKEDNDDLLIELDQTRDHNHSLLCDIRENLETIITYIEDSKHIDRKQLLKLLNETWRICNNEL